MRKKSNCSEIEVTIQMKFGSDFQKQVLMSILDTMLRALKSSALEHHKNNSVAYISDVIWHKEVIIY